MRTRIEKITEILTELRDKANDESIIDDLNDAILNLESVLDRLLDLELEEEEDL